MRNLTGNLTKTLSAALCLLFLASPIWATPGDAPAGTMTVGDFFLLYARSIHLALPANASAEAAYESLKANEILPSGSFTMSAPLTHAVVLRIGKAAGLKVTSRTPDKVLARPEAELFLQTFAGPLASIARQRSGDVYAASFNPPGDPAGHANTSKGKKKGRPFQSDNEPGPEDH